MICGRRQDNLNNALDELRAMGHRKYVINFHQGSNEVNRKCLLSVSGMICNVSYEDDLKALVEKTKKVFGGIDILVNNAAVNPVNGKLNPLEVSNTAFLLSTAITESVFSSLTSSSGAN